MFEHHQIEGAQSQSAAKSSVHRAIVQHCVVPHLHSLNREVAVGQRSEHLDSESGTGDRLLEVEKVAVAKVAEDQSAVSGRTSFQWDLKPAHVDVRQVASKVTQDHLEGAGEFKVILVRLPLKNTS